MFWRAHFEDLNELKPSVVFDNYVEPILVELFSAELFPDSFLNADYYLLNLEYLHQYRRYTVDESVVLQPLTNWVR